MCDIQVEYIRRLPFPGISKLLPKQLYHGLYLFLSWYHQLPRTVNGQTQLLNRYPLNESSTTKNMLSQPLSMNGSGNKVKARTLSTPTQAQLCRVSLLAWYRMMHFNNYKDLHALTHMWKLKQKLISQKYKVEQKILEARKGRGKERTGEMC